MADQPGCAAQQRLNAAVVQRRAAEKEAEDPRPDRKQFRDAEVALVAKRCGAGAMRKARNRLGKSMKPSRRARDASSVLGMMLLRSQGFGMVHPEQDVFWIEHELLMAKERIEPRRERLIELGITHILKARPPRPNLTTGPFLSSAMYARRAQVGPVLSNQHPQDFIYCRLYVSDKETARQDDIRREFGMGLAFASEALDLGGRVLICCPTGCRLAVAHRASGPTRGSAADTFGALPTASPVYGTVVKKLVPMLKEAGRKEWASG